MEYFFKERIQLKVSCVAECWLPMQPTFKMDAMIPMLCKQPVQSNFLSRYFTLNIHSVQFIKAASGLVWT
jgi:hypothetical protein